MKAADPEPIRDPDTGEQMMLLGYPMVISHELNRDLAKAKEEHQVREMMKRLKPQDDL